MSAKVILVWFRNDLRLHDNEVLLNAVQKSDFIIPVYIFDPRYYSTNKYNFFNTGELRKNFIIQAVFSFKKKLQSLGGDLLTFEGYPEDIIPQLVQKYDVDEVYHHREIAQRETSISEAVETALWNVKRNLKHFIGHTLFHKEDFPFPVRDIPTDFNIFKKKINKESIVRPSFPSVESITIPPHLEKTPFPDDIDQLNLIQDEETAFLALDMAINDAKNETDLYWRISPYIAHGMLSPIYSYHQLISKANKSNKKGINTLIDNLLRRDYFRFMLKKFPNCYFINECENVEDINLIKAWTEGTTDNVTINTIMNKLNTTGILNAQERIYTSLYFIYELKQNWLVGASWFEQQLIDYAPATIYGYWAHYAEQGTSIKNNKTVKDWEKLKENNTNVVETL